jgi:SAM-dependent methyltransferase
LPILKIADYVEFYRHLAASSDIHPLSGRGDDLAATEFASSRILEALELAPDDVLLDIGCGDGCLLKMAGERVGKRIGIVPSVEEQRKPQTAVPESTILVGMVQDLPLASESASKIVCNSVLLLLQTDEIVLAALREVSRVARPDARIWLGEIPATDEHSGLGVYRGHSVAGFIRHQFETKGPRAFLGSCKRVMAALVGSETLILNSAQIYYASPEKFISMAERCGLKPVSHFKYRRLDQSGQVVESPFRYNYTFVK